MNSQRDLISFLTHEIRLGEQGLHPDLLANLRIQLAEAKSEYWRQFKQGLDADEKFYEAHRPKAKPPTVLRPMSMDDYFQGREIKTQNCEERPDL